MGEGKQEVVNKNRPLEKESFRVIKFAIVVMALATIAFILKFWELPFGGPKDWAAFATYFSGVTTPVVALCSAWLFYRSISIQKVELERASQAMENTALMHEKAVVAQREANRLILAEQVKQEKIKTQEQRKRVIEQLKQERVASDSKLGAFLYKDSGSVNPLSIMLQNGTISIENVYHITHNNNQSQLFARELIKYVVITAQLGNTLAELLEVDIMTRDYDKLSQLIADEKPIIEDLLYRYNVAGNSWVLEYPQKIEKLKHVLAFRNG